MSNVNKEKKMSAFYEIRKPNTKNFDTNTACGNGMPGSDAQNITSNPVDGRDNKKKAEIGRSQLWSRYT